MDAQKLEMKLSETPKNFAKLQKSLKVMVEYGKMYIRHYGDCMVFAQPAPFLPIDSIIHTKHINCVNADLASSARIAIGGIYEY